MKIKFVLILKYLRKFEDSDYPSYHSPETYEKICNYLSDIFKENKILKDRIVFEYFPNRDMMKWNGDDPEFFEDIHIPYNIKRIHKLDDIVEFYSEFKKVLEKEVGIRGLSLSDTEVEDNFTYDSIMFDVDKKSLKDSDLGWVIEGSKMNLL